MVAEILSISSASKVPSISASPDSFKFDAVIFPLAEICEPVISPFKYIEPLFSSVNFISYRWIYSIHYKA